VVLSAIDESLVSVSVETPVLLTPDTEIIGLPDNPDAVVAVVAVPVRFPTKVVAVAIPVITTPSGNVGALPAVLPLRFVTLKSDIIDLLVAVYQ
jgi:hypothetical protein